jgi:hypothetical protein
LSSKNHPDEQNPIARDEVLKRMLKMPPKPHKTAEAAPKLKQVVIKPKTRRGKSP